jgi:hypothetical protein
MPPAMADRARKSFLAASQLGGTVADHANVTFLHGIHTALLVGSGASLIAAVAMTLLLPSAVRRARPACRGRRLGLPMPAFRRLAMQIG